MISNFQFASKCRQEVMDIIAKSGKFNQKFEGFTGQLLIDGLKYELQVAHDYAFTAATLQ